MATERLSMRNLREILRQKLQLKRTHRAVAKALGVSNGAVGSLMVRQEALGLTWEQAETLKDDELEQRLYGPKLPSTATRPMPDMLGLLRELKRPGEQTPPPDVEPNATVVPTSGLPFETYVSFTTKGARRGLPTGPTWASPETTCRAAGVSELWRESP